MERTEEQKENMLGSDLFLGWVRIRSSRAKEISEPDSNIERIILLDPEPNPMYFGLGPNLSGRPEA